MDEPHLAPDVLVRQDAGWQQIVTISPDRPTWLEIDLGAIAHNVRRLKELAGEAHLMISLKADAYGHGAIQVAQTALLNGATWLGVACFGEGVALRQAGIQAPILVLGYTPAWQARDVLRHDLTATVFDLDVAHAFSRARWRWTAPRASTSRWTPAWDGWASSRTRRWHSFAHCASSLAWSSKASSPTSRWLTEPATGSRRIAPNSLPLSRGCWPSSPPPTPHPAGARRKQRRAAAETRGSRTRGHGETMTRETMARHDPPEQARESQLRVPASSIQPPFHARPPRHRRLRPRPVAPGAAARRTSGLHWPGRPRWPR